MKLKIFVDSDVVISSLISSSGAAHLLLNQENLQLTISNLSLKEIKEVAKRLNIAGERVDQLITKLKIVKMSQSLPQIKKEYTNFVYDQDDAHIIAAAVLSKAKYLISYNQKDFNSNQIKMHFDIILMTPGQFLQYLRSL
jgi:predicted nucleic acid-binding protein